MHLLVLKETIAVISHPRERGEKYENIITVEHVTKKFKDATVLKDVNINFEKGKTHEITGRNSFGKNVLIKNIYGFMPLTESKITIAGKIIGKDVGVP